MQLDKVVGVEKCSVEYQPSLLVCNFTYVNSMHHHEARPEPEPEGQTRNYSAESAVPAPQ